MTNAERIAALNAPTITEKLALAPVLNIEAGQRIGRLNINGDGFQMMTVLEVIRSSFGGRYFSLRVRLDAVSQLTGRPIEFVTHLPSPMIKV